MAKIEIDKNGQVNGLPPDEIEKNGCLTEMSANKTVCLLSEKCDKGVCYTHHDNGWRLWLSG